MNKVRNLPFFVFALCLFAFDSFATLRFGKAEGTWNDPNAWYDDENGNEARVPREGDDCFISPKSVCMIEKNTVVSNLNIWVGRRNDGVGKLVVEEGCLITNCTIDVAQVAGTVTVSNEFAVLELNQATVIDSTLTFRK